MKQYDLYIFDVDGTIAERDTTDLLPGVTEWFAGNQTAVAFATNQGGVGLRYWMEAGGFGEPEKYPTEEQVMKRLRSIADRVSVSPLNIYACFAYQSKSSGKWAPSENDGLFWEHAWRKPEPWMLIHAMEMAGAESAVMIGDSDEDEAAARAAGIDFIHANEFFGREN